MVEVFSTNVKDQVQARMLIGQICSQFQSYRANFDLEDCDNILRIQCDTENIATAGIIDLLMKFGFRADVLSDDVNPLFLTSPIATKYQE